jgi:hypothetical protein
MDRGAPPPSSFRQPSNRYHPRSSGCSPRRRHDHER